MDFRAVCSVLCYTLFLNVSNSAPPISFPLISEPYAVRVSLPAAMAGQLAGIRRPVVCRLRHLLALTLAQHSRDPGLRRSHASTAAAVFRLR